MPTIKTNGIQTYYERTGDGAPIVFVHGLGMDSRTWAPQVEALSSDYEVITYDQRNHGETERIDPAEVSVELLADDLRALITQLGIENPILCGHSFAGLIINEYATRHPEDVSGLVFAEARVEMGEKWWEPVYTSAQPIIGRIERIVGEERLHSITSFLMKHLEGASRGDDPELDSLGMSALDYMEEAAAQHSRDEKAQFMEAGFDHDTTPLPELDVPILFVYGEKGADIIKNSVNGIEDEVEIESIADADHFISLQKPQLFNDLLTRFATETFESQMPVESQTTHD